MVHMYVPVRCHSGLLGQRYPSALQAYELASLAELEMADGHTLLPVLGGNEPGAVYF